METVVMQIVRWTGWKPCPPARRWLGRRTSLARAWRDCRNADWMFWLLSASSDRRRRLDKYYECRDTVEQRGPGGYRVGFGRRGCDIVRKFYPKPPRLGRSRR